MDKSCGNCKKVLNLVLFSKDSASSDGHQSWCRLCRKNYYHTDKGKESITRSAKKYRNTDSYKNYISSDKHKKYLKEYRNKVKAIAFSLVGGGKVECSRCLCANTDILEINHINGGGRQEFKSLKLYGYGFYLSIACGRRKPQDLNILCKICNMADYVKRRFDVNYGIVYKGTNSP